VFFFFFFEFQKFILFKIVLQKKVIKDYQN